METFQELICSADPFLVCSLTKRNGNKLKAKFDPSEFASVCSLTKRNGNLHYHNQQNTLMYVCSLTKRNGNGTYDVKIEPFPYLPGLQPN